MNLSPLQLDTNCFNTTSHYHSAYYTNNTSAWSSSSSSSPPLPPPTSLLCPSTITNYQPSFIPSVLQPIENYCSIESFYPLGSEPIASSSDIPYYPSSTPLPHPLPTHSIHPYPTNDFIVSSSSSSAMILPQNRANYTRHQLVMLNEIFKKHKYPNSLQKTLISKYIGVSRDQIRIWFQNKRRKVQLITKGQAKQTKTDVECEYGEYRRHLPNNFLDDLFQELYKARAAPARLPVKRDNNSKINNTEHEHLLYYPPMNSTTYCYQPNNIIEHDDSSHGQNDQQYSTNYSYHMY
ncbi:unnamed protein product [Adineta steineri]|uniref:Homeobox domain-containing protein n=1 Tax=Adineta steineri TaxID=433720 RepID=A0A813SYQ4_9BILA|nr:unnamed protein product [Adineta steineri]CAF3667626.1 unnamed protein product [Adineta steineri]